MEGCYGVCNGVLYYGFISHMDLNFQVSFFISLITSSVSSFLHKVTLVKNEKRVFAVPRITLND